MASESSTGKGRGEGFLILERDDATLCVVVNRIGPRVPECDAAALVLESLRTTFASGGSVDETFAAISNANRKVVGLSDAAKRRDPGVDVRWHGMGATIDVVFFASGRAHLAHVGDGSVFRLRQGSLETLTTPHTLTNEYRRQRPNLTEVELAQLPANVIVRALGMRSDLEIDRGEFDTSSGDTWLLCSGALTSSVPDSQIRSVLERGNSVETIARNLLDATRDRSDDIALAVHVVG